MAEELVVTIKIDKKKNPMMFDKISQVGDLNKYFEYLINLDYILNGTDQEYSVVVENKDNVSYSIDVAVSNLAAYIQEIDKAIPEEYRNVFYGPENGIINIPTDASFENLKLEINKLSQLLEARKAER